MGRAIVSFLFGLVVLGIFVAIGAGIYQAGVTQGVIEAGRVPVEGGVPVAGYGYGYGFHGFGFLGLLFPLLFLLLIFGLLRAAFSRGRGWGPGWGRGYGPYGWGPGWDKGEGPTAWREERERRMAELHRRLHDEESGGGSGNTGPSGSTGSSS